MQARTDAVGKTAALRAARAGVHGGNGGIGALVRRRDPFRRSRAGISALALGSALAAGFAAGPAHAQVTDLSPRRDLQFGDAAGDGDLSGTVTVSPSGTKTVGGGAFDLGGNHQSGEFRLRGDRNTQYSCTLPSQIQITSGGNSLTVDGFTTDPPLTGSLGGSGQLFMTVGGTLQIPPGQAAGQYSGILSMDCDGQIASVAVDATLLSVIAISNTVALEFGSMIPEATSGTVTVSTTGARSAVNVTLFGGSVAAAGFTVTGEAGQAYGLQLPSSITIGGPGGTMTVDGFVDDASLFLTGGSDSFSVGATLHVGADQPRGDYGGSFAVVVSYN